MYAADGGRPDSLGSGNYRENAPSKHRDPAMRLMSAQLSRIQIFFFFIVVVVVYSLCIERKVGFQLPNSFPLLLCVYGGGGGRIAVGWKRKAEDRDFRCIHLFHVRRASIPFPSPFHSVILSSASCLLLRHPPSLSSLSSLSSLLSVLAFLPRFCDAHSPGFLHFFSTVPPLPPSHLLEFV